MTLILKVSKDRLSNVLDPGSQRSGAAPQLMSCADIIFFCNSIHHADFSRRHFLKGLFAGAKDRLIFQFSLLQDSVFSWLLSISFSFCHMACLLTAPLVVSLCVPARLSPLCPPWPGTAYRTPRRPHSCSALLTGDHRLKPGRIADTRCLCVWCFAGTPSAQEMLSAFFPPSCSVVGHYNRIQLPSQSIPRWFQPLPAIGSHRQWGYAIISDWLEQRVSSCERAKLFMAEQRSSSFTIGNYHAHSPPSPPFNLWSVCRWVRLGAD